MKKPNKKSYMIQFTYRFCSKLNKAEIFCCYGNEHKAAIDVGDCYYTILVDEIEKFLEDYENKVIKKQLELMHKYWPVDPIIDDGKEKVTFIFVDPTDPIADGVERIKFRLKTNSEKNII